MASIPDLGNISRHEAVEGAGYYYGLTEIGGGAWENLARPQWCLFFEDTHLRLDEKEYLELSGLTVERIGRVFELLERCHLMQLSPRTEENAELVSPWSATYWKAFSQGAKQRVQLLRRDRHERLFTDKECWSLRVWRRYGFSLNTCEELVQ